MTSTQPFSDQVFSTVTRAYDAQDESDREAYLARLVLLLSQRLDDIGTVIDCVERAALKETS
jgi:hypothetical protein